MVNEDSMKKKEIKWLKDRGFSPSVGRSTSISLKPSTSIFLKIKKKKTRVKPQKKICHHRFIPIIYTGYEDGKKVSKETEFRCKNCFKIENRKKLTKTSTKVKNGGKTKSKTKKKYFMWETSSSTSTTLPYGEIYPFNFGEPKLSFMEMLRKLIRKIIYG